MVRNQTYNKGITYVIIAMLCLANLFLGAKVITKMSNIKKATEINEGYINEEKVLTVFNVENSSLGEEAVGQRKEDEGKINVEKSKKISKSSNDKKDLFLKILLNSNTYMKIVYERDNNESEIDKSKNSLLNNLSVLFKPDFYIKPHLPAIVSAFNEKYPWEKETLAENKASDLEGYLILSDIIFIEDPEEKNDIKQDIELIGKKHEDLIFIEPPKTVTLDHTNPYVLLYHTHGTEAYLPITTERFHSEKREYNVITIGEIIGSKLQESGHKLKHVDVYHDIPSYNDSYIRSLSTLKEELKKNESIKVIFDIHRDGIEGDEASVNRAQEAARITIDGKSVATFSLVIGPDNPNKEQLIKFANYIRHTSESMYPGLCKGIIVKPKGKFNQFVSDYYALIEVGSNLNTLDEAKESAKYIGEILHKVLEGIDKAE